MRKQKFYERISLGCHHAMSRMRTEERTIKARGSHGRLPRESLWAAILHPHSFVRPVGDEHIFFLSLATILPSQACMHRYALSAKNVSDDSAASEIVNGDLALKVVASRTSASRYFGRGRRFDVERANNGAYLVPSTSMIRISCFYSVICKAVVLPYKA